MSFTTLCVHQLSNISVNVGIAKSETKQLKQLTDNFSFALSIRGTIRVTNKSKTSTTTDLMLMSQGPVLGVRSPNDSQHDRCPLLPKGMMGHKLRTNVLSFRI